jgi:uncharacterized protein YjbJ (UPF0337 family)
MLKIKDAQQAGLGLADKTVGLALELAGTVIGNDRLKDAGRSRQEAGSERLMSVEETAKSTRYKAQAEASEQRQRANQDPSARSSGRKVSQQGSPGSAVAESVKGTAKKAVGSVTGNEKMKAEGEAQTDKAESQGKAAKHEARATAHEKKADAEKSESERRAG